MAQQQLIRTEAGAGHALQVNGRAVTAAHEQVVAIIRSRLGQNHADYLARPAPEADGAVRWSTHLAGTVRAAGELGADERDKLQRTAERLAGDIRGLAAQMQGEGPATQMVGQMLERAAQVPSGDWLYSVGGKPVTVMWGHAGSALAAAALPPVGTGVAGAAPAGAAVAGAGVAGAGAAAVKGGWLRMLGWGALALVVLAAVLFGLKQCKPGASGPSSLGATVEDLKRQNQKLEQDIVQKRNQRSPWTCVPEPPKPPEPPASVPEPPASKPEPPASKPLPPVSKPKPVPPVLTEDQKKVRDRGGKEGKLEVILSWAGLHDLDLYVTCPSGEKIWAKALSACGGQLDIDANGSGNPKVTDPVEHVAFGQPPRGKYRVEVANCERAGTPDPFRLSVVYEGKVIRQLAGMSPVTDANHSFCGRPALVLEFTIPP